MGDAIAPTATGAADEALVQTPDGTNVVSCTSVRGGTCRVRPSGRGAASEREDGTRRDHPIASFRVGYDQVVHPAAAGLAGGPYHTASSASRLEQCGVLCARDGMYCRRGFMAGLSVALWLDLVGVTRKEFSVSDWSSVG
jgi:hypothetical protein